jgi:hypothetical protein
MTCCVDPAFVDALAKAFESLPAREIHIIIEYD